MKKQGLEFLSSALLQMKGAVDVPHLHWCPHTASRRPVKEFVVARETECAGAAFGSLKMNHRLSM